MAELLQEMRLRAMTLLTRQTVGKGGSGDLDAVIEVLRGDPVHVAALVMALAELGTVAIKGWAEASDLTTAQVLQAVGVAVAQQQPPPPL
jgi:membrane protein required for beta-lactamase induction